MQQQNDGNDRDRAERIAAAQRLLAQALASGISARSMEESLLGGANAPAQSTAEQIGSVT